MHMHMKSSASLNAIYEQTHLTQLHIACIVLC